MVQGKGSPSKGMKTSVLIGWLGWVSLITDLLWWWSTCLSESDKDLGSILVTTKHLSCEPANLKLFGVSEL